MKIAPGTAMERVRPRADPASFEDAPSFTIPPAE